MRLEFTTTACRRPGIFRDTLQSFAANLRGVEFKSSRLYLNIDPTPAHGDSEAVANVAREVFGEVVVNMPETPCFPAAVTWCWSQPSGELFFHLEDDWLLQRPIDINEMLSLFQADPALSVVNCRAYPHSDDRICLAPGAWRTAHAKVIAQRLRDDWNPEMQLRAINRNNPYGGAHEGFKGMQYPKDRVLKDIGRLWMKVNGLHRDRSIMGASRHFVRWA